MKACFALAFALLAAAVHAAVIKEITPRSGGLNGQTRVTISGTGFDERGRSNDVYIGDKINGVFCDPIPNECHTTRIVCLTGKAKVGGVLPLEVRSFGFLASCKANNGCKFEYSSSLTPHVTALSPQYIVPPAIITVSGSNFQLGDATVGAFDFTMFLGEEERCELLPGMTSTSFRCKVDSVRPGTVPVRVVLGTRGEATLAQTASTIVVLPSITGVSPAVGSTAGGTLVTVEGTSFSEALSENEVTIHGAPCVVTGQSQNELYCRTNARVRTTPAERVWATGRVLYERWLNLPGTALSSWIPRLEYLRPDETSFLDEFKVPNLRCDDCAVRITAHFVPATTGTYVMTARGDDEFEFWVGRSEAPEPREQEKSADRDQIIDVDQFNSRMVAKGTYSSNPKGKPLNLTAGERYWIRAFVKNGGGSSYINPSIKGPDGQTVTLTGDRVQHSPDWQSPVAVKVRGTPALMGADCLAWGSCAYDYAAASTPVVTSVSPSAVVVGDSITVYGSFGAFGPASTPGVATKDCAEVTTCGGGGCACKTSELCGQQDDACEWVPAGLGTCRHKTAQMCGRWSRVKVTVGGAPCAVTEETAALVKCRLGFGAAAGSVAVRVEMDGIGLAGTTLVVTLSPSIRKLAPATGSLSGGNTLTILGSGFDTMPGSTTVSVGGTACPVVAVETYKVVCTVPAGSAGNANVIVTTRDRTAYTAPYGWTYVKPFERPGTAQAAAPASLSRRHSALSAGTVLSITAPRVDIAAGDKTTVAFGDCACRVSTAFSSTIKCVLGGVSVPETRAGSLTVVRADGSVYTEALPSITFRRTAVSSEGRLMSPNGGNYVRIYVDGPAFPMDAVQLRIAGQECDALRVAYDQITRRRISCWMGPKPATLPALPQIYAHTFSNGNGLTNPFATFDVTPGVKFNADGSVTVPAGSNWISTKARFAKPYVFRAKVKPSRTLAENPRDAAVTIRSGITEPSVWDDGTAARVGYTNDGRMKLVTPSCDTTPSTKEFQGAFAAVGLDSAQYMEYALEVGIDRTTFSINGQVIARCWSNEAPVKAAVGFGFSEQAIQVKDFVVEDMRPRTVDLNVSGVPVRMIDDIVYEGAARITSVVPNYAFAGGKITVYGSGFSGRQYIVALPAEDATADYETPVLCNANAGRDKAGAWRVICTVGGDVPAGDIWIGARAHTTSSNSGLASGAFKIAFSQTLSSVGPSTIPAAGAIVTINGGGFDAGVTAKVGGQPCPVISWRRNRLLCVAPAGSGTVAVSIFKQGSTTALSGCSTCQVKYNSQARAIISAASPATGPAGTTVTFTGTNFAGNCWADFGDTPASRVSQSSSSLRFTAPAAASTGAVTVTVGCSTSGSAIFGAGVAATFTYTAGAVSVSNNQASTAGSSLITVVGGGIAMPAGAAVAAHTFSSAVEEGWSFKPAMKPITCNGVGLFGWSEPRLMTKTLTGLGSHTALRIAYDVMMVNDQSLAVYVDGQRVAVPRTRCYVGWTCLDNSNHRTCRREGVVVVPHTASSVTFGFDAHTHRFGIVSYSVQALASIPHAVTVGGAACAVQTATPHEISCLTPAGSGSAAVAVSVAGSAVPCPGCTVEYEAAKVPAPQLVVAAEDHVANTTRVPLLVARSTLLSYSAAGAAVRRTSGGDSWSRGAGSPQGMRKADGPKVGVRVTVAAGAESDRQMHGLTYELSVGTSYQSLQYAAYLDNGRFRIYENGRWLSDSAYYTAGDVVEVYYEAACNCVKYAVNNAVVFVSDEPVARWPLFYQAHLYDSANAGAKDITFIAARPATTRLVIPTTGMTSSSAAAATIAGTACYDVYATEGQFSCWVPTSAAAALNGTVAVAVTGGKYGAGAAATVPVVEKAVSFASDATGSTEGGHRISFAGAGFTAATVITLNGTVCPVSSFTSGSIECTTPALEAGDHPVVVTTGTAHTCVMGLSAGLMATATAVGCADSKYTAGASTTAQLSSVSPASVSRGEDITITGTGFGSSPVVTLGGVACVVKSTTATEIKCTVGVVTPGTAAVVATFPGSGLAAGSASTSVVLAVASLSFTQSGNLGGAVLTITGTGFTPATTVKIGATDICASKAVVGVTIECTTAAVTAAGPVVLADNGATAQSSQTLTFATAFVPVLTTSSPTIGASGAGVLIQGSNLGAGTITMGTTECTIGYASPSFVVCVLGGGPTGTHGVQFVSKTHGRSTGAVQFTVYFSAATVAPARGPTKGSQAVSIAGAGFSTTAADMRVSLSGVPCVVSASAIGGLSCTTTAATDVDIEARHDVVVSILRSTNSTTASATSYTYDNALTATVTAITPAAGSASGNELLTITGTNFHAELALNVVSIGGARCIVEQAVPTQLVCRTSPQAPAHEAPVTVVVNEQGVAAGSAVYSPQLNVTSVSSTSVSVEGGLALTMTGNGFWPMANATVWAYKHYKATVGGKPCVIVSATSTELVCTLPAAPRPFEKVPALITAYPMRPELADAAVALTGNGIAAVVSATVSYTHAATPRISSTTAAATLKSGDSVTVAGTGFAATGNIVSLGATACAATSESTTQIVCTVGSGVSKAGLLRVMVPGKGYASASKQCPAGSYLMCNGACVSDCSYAPWGHTSCAQIAGVTMGDSFCDSKGGSDRVNIPFKIDNGVVFDMNCPMYSCEGGDCDKSVYVGGTGGVVSSCGMDPNGPLVTVAPHVASVSPATSAAGGGRTITVAGSNFGTVVSGVTVAVNGVVCAVTSVTETQIVCETGVQQPSTGKVQVFRNAVESTCGTCAFEYVSNGPAVTSTAPSFIVATEAFTVVGSNFGASPVVHVGGKLCAVSTATATQIVCTAPQLASTKKHMVVVTAAVGSSMPVEVSYAFRVAEVSPAAGSTAGGATVVIRGSGFSSTTTVSFASCAAATTAFNATSGALTVTTPTGCDGDVKVRLYHGTTESACGSCRYNFATASTPVVASVTAAGNQLTMAVSSFPAGAVAADVAVTVGSAPCGSVSLTASQLQCTVDPSNHVGGTYPVQVKVAALGLAKHTTAPAPTFALPISVASISPAAGSLGGGQEVTVAGAGFGTAAAMLKVTVAGTPCTVTAVAAAQIKCKTAQVDAVASGAVQVDVVDARATTAGTAQGGTYAFSEAVTPRITSVSPSRGSSAGGTRLTMAGSNLVGITSVLIAGRPCTQDASQTAISTAVVYYCTTAAHRPMLEAVRVHAATSNNGEAYTTSTYQYVDLWSRQTTWGNTPPPVEGDSAVVPEGNLVMLDYTPPRLHLVVVMGHLIFDDTQDLEFHCTYVMINFGRFTVGTPEKPYLKKATITLYGDRLTPEIPVHGAKVIALRHGALDMHGEVRQPTWTHLADTVAAGAAKLKVKGPVDWRVGEFIVVAPTDYEFLHAEHRQITGVTPADGQAAEVTLDLEYPLEHEHYGRRQCYGTGADEVCVDEIAEVGLLSRNIVVQGDRSSRHVGFGGTMFLMPLGEDQDRYARLSFIELRNVGQQFIVGRYPVHFHVTHEINNSYVNGTAVHESLNRAFSVHGIQNGTFINNIGYDVQGHALFIEDGSEKYNHIERNLLLKVKASTSNLNTDLTPACIWITNPNNRIIGNAAGGSHAYGLWISPFEPHSTGPTHSTDICPAGEPLLEWRDNTAHSARKYGVNIFRNWFPREQPCNSGSKGVTAYLRNTTSYKNHIHGVTMGNQEAGVVGSVVIDGWKIADNGRTHGDGSGYWVEKISAANMTTGIQNSALFAVTANKPFTRRGNRRGINLPEGDNFFSENITFVNYAGKNFAFEPQAWAERMSLCFPWGWEAVSRGLKWIDSPNRILFRFDHHGVLNDDDGTLTGIAESQAITKSAYFDDSICTTDSTKSLRTALFCPSTYKIRRIGQGNMNQFYTDQLWTIDGRTETVFEILRAYLTTAPINKAVSLNFQYWQTPQTWTWNVQTRRFWRDEERIMFKAHYNTSRHHVYVRFGGLSLDKNWDGPVPELNDTRSSYSFNNETGHLTALMLRQQNSVSAQAYNCPESGCPQPPSGPQAYEQNCKSFHDKSNWESNAVPNFNGGDSLTIGTNEVLCLAENYPGSAQRACSASSVFTYDFFSLRLEGGLQLRDEHCPCEGATIHLKVSAWMWIRQGGLMVGTPDAPLTKCNFRLSIAQAPPTNDVTQMGRFRLNPWGFRALAVESGLLRLHGTAPSPVFTRLAENAAAGSTTVRLTAAVNWKLNDFISIAGTQQPSQYMEVSGTYGTHEQSERVQIVGISTDMRTLTVQPALQYAHTGSGDISLGHAKLNPGAEVASLARSIQIDAGIDDVATEPAEQMGWQLQVGCTAEGYQGCSGGGDSGGWPMTSTKHGRIQLDGVRMQHVGQAKQQKGGLDFDGLLGPSSGDDRGSWIRRCVIEKTFNIPILVRKSSEGLALEHNVVFDYAHDGFAIGAPGVTVTGNLLMKQSAPDSDVCDKVYFIFDDCRTAAFRLASGVVARDNIAASGVGAGYLTLGDHCTGPARWSDNVAHGFRDGILTVPVLSPPWMMFDTSAARPSSCRRIAGVSAYNMGDHGLVVWYAPGSLEVMNVVSVNNQVGLMAILQGPATVGRMSAAAGLKAKYTNLTIAGSFESDAPCQSREWQCKKSLLDGAPWCKLLHKGQGRQPINRAGFVEALFSSHDFGIGKTKGEQKFRWLELDSYVSIHGQAQLRDVHFANFDGNDACGKKNIAFYQNPHSNDTFHQHTFEGISWSGIRNGGEFWARRAYGDAHKKVDDVTNLIFMDYENFKYGPNLPDSPNHVMLIDKDGSFSGRGKRTAIMASESFPRTTPFIKMGYDGKAFLAGSQQLDPARPGCEFQAKWNAWQCDERYELFSVVIDSLAEDRMTRRVAPVVLCKGDGMVHTNGYPICQGGAVQYATGPVSKTKAHRATLDRESRFWLHVEDKGNYTLNFRSNPPERMRFYTTDHEHLSRGNNVGVTFNLRYFGENSQARIAVYVDGVRQRSVVGSDYPWTQRPAQTWPASTDPAGTHYHDRFVDGNVVRENSAQGFQRNVLSFTLRPGATVDLVAEPIIQVSMDLAMTVDDFFNNKETFVAALATVLGIPGERLRIVNVVPGTTARRAAASSKVEIEVDQDPTVSATYHGADTTIAEQTNDLDAVVAKFSQFESNPQAATGFVVSNVKPTKVSVVVPLAPVRVAEGTPYVAMNVSRTDKGVVNATELHAAMVGVMRSTFSPNATFAKMENDDFAVGNTYFNTTSNQMRLTAMALFDTEEFGVSVNKGAAEQWSTLLKVQPTAIPGYLVHGLKYEHNGYSEQTSKDDGLSTAAMMAFGLGAAIGLVVVVAVGGGLLYYFIIVRSRGQEPPAKPVEKVEPGFIVNEPPTASDVSPRVVVGDGMA